jgi:hypothetical protein
MDEAHMLKNPLQPLLPGLTEVNYCFWQAEQTPKGYGLA